MTSSPIPLSAQLTAVAVVASAKVYGDDPSKALGPGSARMHRRCLAPATAALMAHTGQTAKAICALLKTSDANFYTARSAAYPPFADAQAAAEAALATLGPAYVRPPAEERARGSREAWVQKTNQAKVAKPKNGPITAALVEERTAPAVVVDRPLPGPLTAGLPGQSGIRPAENGALRAATATVHRLPELAPERQARAVRSSSAYSRATSIRLKTITPRVLRYCERFLRADWDLEEVAELFDVSPDALAIQCRGRVA